MGTVNVVGQILDGKYEIEGQLGEGGMGAVYHATHLGTKRPVAVKVIAPEFVRRSEFIERFRREAQAAGRLRHPNVVDVTDFGFAKILNGEEIAYLVMELLDGCTLGEILKEESSVPLEFTLNIVDQVSLAIEAAHNRGIIHRDIKPDNIWLEPNHLGGYTVKVLDFGIAKVEEQATEEIVREESDFAQGDAQLTAETPQETRKTKIAIEPTSSRKAIEEDNAEGSETKLLSSNEIQPENETLVLTDEGQTAILSTEQPISNEKSVNVPVKEKGNVSVELTRAGDVLGTPLYMSPEQCRGEKLTASTDIYSLGVLVYQMLEGKTPFTGSFKEVMVGQISEEPPPLEAPRIGKKSKQVVMHALRKKPEDRPKSAIAFANELRGNSNGFFSILRKAFVVYSEQISIFIKATVVLAIPYILFIIFRSIVVIGIGLKFFGFGNGTGAIDSSLMVLDLLMQVLTVSFIGAISTWIVAQTLAYPIKTVELKAGLKEIRKYWRPLLSASIIITGFSFIGYMFLIIPGIYLATRWLFSPASVLIERLSARESLKRSAVLTKRTFSTALAIGLLTLVLPTLLSFLISGAISSVLTAYSLTEEIREIRDSGVISSPETFEEGVGARAHSPQAKMLRGLQRGTFQLVWTPMLLAIVSFFNALVAVAYFSARQAGGESIGEMVAKLDSGDELKSEWQKKAQMRLTETGKSDEGVGLN